MKKSIYAIASIVTAVFLLLAAAGCDTMTGPGSGQGAQQNGLAAVSLAIAGTGARTVAPANAKLEDVKAWKLLGAKTGETPQKLLKEFTISTGQALYLETGDWDFTLEGYKDNPGETLILEGAITGKTINLEGPNTLNFMVAPVSAGTGTVKITITLPEGHGITQAKVFKDGADLNSPITPGGNSVVYEASHAAGNYFFSFRLYKESEEGPLDLYGVVSELVKVRRNLVSEKPYTLTAADLNIIYSISYYVDGEKLNGESAKPDYYRSTDAPELPTLSRLGYNFNGWHPDAALSEGPLTEFPTPGEGEDRKFYAEWKIITYDINYELDNKGTNHAANPLTYTVDELPITLQDPTPNGSFRFLYWYVEGFPDTPVTTIPVNSTEEQTFWAKWTPVYPIKYELEGGSGNGGNPATYTVEDLPFILKKPTTNGAYTFLYWYVSGSSDTPVFTIPEGSTGEKTFYAKWHQNGQSLTSAADIGAYLVYADGGDSAADPITLPPVNITLADGTNGWTALLTAISGANKFVALDLSACGMDGMTTTEGEFDPKPAITTGKNKIVSLVLPDAATSIRGGTSGNPTFKGFSVQSVTGNKVETIGGYAFSGNSGLTTLNLPSAISIDRYAFNNTGTKTLTITLGSTAPTLGGWLFNGAGAKTVNVRVPTAASSKYNTTWINDLKYGNTSMIVNIETY